jgi:hypothetical protein
LLEEAYGEEVERARSVLWQLEVLGVTPDASLLRSLIAATEIQAVPWAPLEAFAAGELAETLARLYGIEPVVALTFLSREILAAARCIEAGVQSVPQIEELLGVNRYAAKRALLLAKRLGPSGMAPLWSVLLEAEMAVRGADASAALDLFVARACSPR